MKSNLRKGGKHADDALIISSDSDAEDSGDAGGAGSAKVNTSTPE